MTQVIVSLKGDAGVFGVFDIIIMTPLILV